MILCFNGYFETVPGPILHPILLISVYFSGSSSLPETMESDSGDQLLAFPTAGVPDLRSASICPLYMPSAANWHSQHGAESQQVVLGPAPVHSPVKSVSGRDH